MDKVNKVITRKHKNGFMYNACYGNNESDIDDTSIIKYKWTFRILSTSEGHQRSICIGMCRVYKLITKMLEIYVYILFKSCSIITIFAIEVTFN